MTNDREALISHIQALRYLKRDAWTNAKTLHVACALFLRRRGCAVTFEWPTPYTDSAGQPRRGKIDLLVQYGCATAALELDRDTPRVKSLAKLFCADVTLRVVVLRSARITHAPFSGIDLLITPCASASATACLR